MIQKSTTINPKFCCRCFGEDCHSVKPQWCLGRLIGSLSAECGLTLYEPFTWATQNLLRQATATSKTTLGHTGFTKRAGLISVS
jgi:hypothetical protein